jgi:hypothetical protein
MIRFTDILLVLVLVAVLFSSMHSKTVVVQSAPYVGESQHPQRERERERGADDRYARAPRPQRFWDNGPEIPTRGTFSSLDPIPTRGAPESYQQMGVMVGSDGKALPLYGRRTAPRSDKFNYYTRTDTYNPVALPVTYMNKDCQDNIGCNEVSSGDSIRISPTGETAKVTLYGFDGPRYSPDIA